MVVLGPDGVPQPNPNYFTQKQDMNLLEIQRLFVNVL